MPEPVIVPPPPTITQPSAPGTDNSPGLEQLQQAFDRVLPEIKKTPKAATEPVKAADKPVEKPAEVKPPDTQQPTTPVAKPDEKPVEKPAETHVPSFLEEALRLEPSQPAAVEVDAEWSDDLPQEQKQSRIKGLRDAYKRVKGELEAALKRPAMDEATTGRITQVEGENKQLREVLTRMGVEQSAEFQNNVLRPLHGAWNEAVRVVQEAGGDPNGLVRAMSMNGKEQFEALDELFEGMPESAKSEATNALRSYRHFENMRRTAIANAPKTMEGIRQRETERQFAAVRQQKQEMAGMLDAAIAKLRDEAKVEVFMRSADPKWNEVGEKIIAEAKDLFLENTDMNRVAMACLLAPAADTYRKLFIRSMQRVSELEKTIKDRIGQEPVLTESPGRTGMTSKEQFDADLKKPFTDVFLREFHKSRSGQR